MSSSSLHVVYLFYSMYMAIFRYCVPINLTHFWNFGAAALVFLVIQMVTGVFLSMYYVPDSVLAFYSIENIMSNVNYGWLISYLHSNGASFFFFAYMCIFLEI